jgi:aminoglycoside phosphotransferase (APT) family kinase protein
VTVRRVDPDILTSVVRRHLGADTSVADLERLSGGASRETWSFTAVDGAGGRSPLILRRDPPGASGLGTQIDEYRLVAAAEAGGVAVAPLRFPLSSDDDLGTGFVMDRVDGETLGKRIVRDEALAEGRRHLARQCGEQLALIHALPLEGSGLRAPDDATSTTLTQLDQLERLVDGFEATRPALELGLRWLRVHAPAGEVRAVVHGDFRVGNLIVGPEGLRAVLDWELAHVGDPGEDLGWLCVRSWRFGGEGRVGGIGDVADLLDGYQAAGGRAVDAGAVRYWEVFGNVRWAVICLVQTFSHLHGLRRSVELAAVGRRVCEVEHDLLELLG